MLFKLLPALLAASSCVSQTWACAPVPRQVQTNSSGPVEYPFTIPGDDAPSDIATRGYFINHLCINVRNATETINWYKQAFGLRLMFTLQVSEHFSISYMGHSHGGRNGTGYQTSDQMNVEKNNIEGLLEIVSLSFPGWNLPAGMKVPNTFSHIGMVVPDIAATQSRLESLNATILKAAGELFTLDGAFSDVGGFTEAGNAISQEELDAITKVLIPVNTPLMYVADPDGNVVEVQSQ